MKTTLILNTDSSGNGGLDVSDYLVSYAPEHNKLWSSDTGRNLAGDNKGTLVGIFTKIKFGIGKKKIPTETLDALNAILDYATVFAKYTDKTGALKTESFYFGDIAYEHYHHRDIPKDISMIANRRR